MINTKYDIILTERIDSYKWKKHLSNVIFENAYTFGKASSKNNFQMLLQTLFTDYHLKIKKVVNFELPLFAISQNFRNSFC